MRRPPILQRFPLPVPELLLDLNALAQTVTEYVRAHAEWAPWIVGLLAFGESVALVSLLIPATVILIGIGALIGASGLDFWPIWSGAVIGAALGDSLSYWLGFHYHEPIARLWMWRSGGASRMEVGARKVARPRTARSPRNTNSSKPNPPPTCKGPSAMSATATEL